LYHPFSTVTQGGSPPNLRYWATPSLLVSTALVTAIRMLKIHTDDNEKMKNVGTDPKLVESTDGVAISVSQKPVAAAGALGRPSE